jgi:glycosyltransferase involved in cell wall biosynthesis
VSAAARPLLVFLISPYHGGSHAQWAEGYAAASRHSVYIIGHEARFWKWRMSGGAATLADGVRRAIGDVGHPDVLLATSMVDLAGLLGLLRRDTAAPAALYMHENQVTYPAAGRTRSEHRLGLITWLSMLAADGIAINSEYHRTALFDSLPAFLRLFPDRTHHHLVDEVAAGVEVLPVGIDLKRLDAHPRQASEPPLILWNHRWDPDKAPHAFLEMMAGVAATDAEFRLALTGERFANQADEFGPAVRRLGDRVVVDAHLERGEYDRVLRRADVVVSTARQEYFGVAVVEGMHAGAFPVLPDRLVYPERVPRALRDRCLYRGVRHGVELIGQALADVEGTRRDAAGLRDVTTAYDWEVVAPRYDDWLGSMTGS